ncbi:unnamed protein product [Mytilus coruscus]|uniref:Uncharacterized protein n=1 Tax=Mytilus coruscus TaxID=42192 RepID=A0A6J8EW60_MYTCO|nr:unnamed protein product [Mytilus coruscus]
MDENQFLKFQKRTHGNPVLERSTIKLSTLQNSLPIKGEFTTLIRNETCGTETKFIVVEGKINSPPLISKSTLIELGMIKITADGSFAKTNHLRIQDLKKDVIVDTEQDRGKMKLINRTLEQKENIQKKDSATTIQEMLMGKRSTPYPATRISTYKAQMNRPIMTRLEYIPRTTDKDENLYDDTNGRDRRYKEKINSSFCLLFLEVGIVYTPCFVVGNFPHGVLG